ncbi:MAG: helix-turn-helix transcriptional regulator [Oscillochloris sp.]|nr:helix-turn-helix transcriptional regulator [Oscillochloris sp.]
MEPDDDILPELMVHDLEAIKLLADERRLRILSLLRRPTTVKAVAQTLDLPPSRLYYHINLLQAQGLIRVVDHNLESGIVEKVYQATARRFLIANPLAAAQPIPDDASSALFAATLDETRREFLQAFAKRDPREGQPPRHPFFSRKAFRLTDAQLTDFHARLDALIREASALAEANRDRDGPDFALTVVFYRQEDPQ